MKTIVIGVALVLASTGLFASQACCQNVGHVDLRTLINSNSDLKSQMTQLRKALKETDAEAATLKKKMDELKNILKKNEPDTPTHKYLQDSYKKLESEYQTKVNSRRASLKQNEAQYFHHFYVQLQAAIAKVAKDKKLGIVIRKAYAAERRVDPADLDSVINRLNQAITFSNVDSIDITPEVKKILDAKKLKNQLSEKRQTTTNNKSKNSSIVPPKSRAASANNLIVHKPQFEYARRFSEGKAYVRDENGQSMFIDVKGNKLFSIRDVSTVGEFHEGLAKVKSKHTDKYGFINTRGRFAIQPKFANVGNFHEGLCRFRDEKKVRGFRLYGFMDKQGRIVMEPKWHKVWHFSHGLALAQLKTKFMYIDKLGKTKIALDTIGSEPFSEGLAMVYSKNKLIFNEPKIRSENGGAGFVDLRGKVVISQDWNEAHSFSEGLAAVQAFPPESKRHKVTSERGLWGFVNEHGRVVIRPLWDRVGQFSNGIAAVNKNEKWGFINQAGKVVVDPIWKEIKTYKADEARDRLAFSEGLVWVSNGNGWGLIDTKGNIVISPRRDWVDCRPFSEGLAAVEMKDANSDWKTRWGYIRNPLKTNIARRTK